MGIPIEEMSIKELKRLLKEQKLAISGTKSDLIKRLKTYGHTDVGVVSSTDVLIIPQEVREMAEEKTVSIAGEAKAIVITDDEEYELASLFLSQKIKRARKLLDDSFDPIIKSWHQGHKQTLAIKRNLEAPLVEAETIVKGVMATYAKEKEKRLLAREAAERESIKSDALEMLLEEVEELYAAGEDELAEQLLKSLDEDEAATPTLPVRAEKPVVKAQGSTIRKVRKYRIVDPTKIKRSFLMPNDKKIRGVVLAMGKEAEDVVGGIEFYEDINIAGVAG